MPTAEPYHPIRTQIAGVNVRDLAERFGTPLYVYSAGMVRERVGAFKNAFRGIDCGICYSVKANSNLSILRLLASLGCGFDVVSGGELQRVLRAKRTATSSDWPVGLGHAAVAGGSGGRRPACGLSGNVKTIGKLAR